MAISSWLNRLLLVLLLPSLSPANAVEFAGFDITGYGRGGVYSSPAGTPRGAYTLGGDMQKFRLGNEGDNGIEVGIGKSLEVGNNFKLGLMYMPAMWNGQSSNAQGYTSISGLSLAPEAKFWVGQRRLRIQDVHIVDRFLMDYGDNIGAGMTDMSLGFAKLGMGVFSSSTLDKSSSSPNGASRINLDLSEISVNQGGALRLLATAVRGNFQMGSQGVGLSLLHNQSDFLTAGLNNSLFLQSSTGHAGLSGQFQGLGDVATGTAEQPGQRSMRIADALNWQRGAFGGQAVAAWQTAKTDGGVNNGKSTRDIAIGARVSYAFSANFKLLTEVGSTSRSMDGQNRQQLNKITIAPTLALAADFWSRPELRFYVTHISWNAAAAAANAGGFGAGGRMANTVAGAQVEAWW
ncbi:carbohydrate porin [Gallionella capsiferriformans]|uniref:carbohydrate porin n=1 Tax=Gallionella capsiferriformans TaxID=370405 RepID=UPI0012329E20|nr:carbohydrate porin [Gallionella capsiferriformans]